jgi:GT2 family glycosyltransferase
MRNPINVSIVLYHHSEFSQIANLVEILKKSIYVNKIYLLDNSEITSNCFRYLQAEYIHNGENLGYGKGHNQAIRKSIEENIPYHLVLNPDTLFDSSSLDNLFKKMESNKEIGLIMPKILNEDGSIQLLPKLLPTPLNLLIRVIRPLNFLFATENKKYHLNNYMDQELNIPIVSGCFSLFRVEVLKDVGMYDNQFFLYFEDFDISRRIHSKYQTIYYPETSIKHFHARGATKKIKLSGIFIISAIKYFNKYGWFLDKERNHMNKKVLSCLNY